MTQKPTQNVSVAIVGVGLVGGEFISQLLSLPKPNPFRLVSISSSKYSLFSPTGLSFSPTGWKSDLSKSPFKPDFSDLTLKLGALAAEGHKVVLVDNTSSDEIARLYPTFLIAGFAVITPNKKAFSGELSLYESILDASSQSGSKVLNEATVGAGLPIISTLKDLVATGDKVKRIEGVFSGTMSYIFNEFSTGQSTGRSFSSIVRIARDKGYTEPHPADDLNGADVARKLAILSRIIPALRAALPAGYKSVNTNSLIPPGLDGVPTGDEFLARLPDSDAQYDHMRTEAAANGQVLRYVGVIDVERGEIKASLEKYPKTHSFATSLGGSDNIIMFHTERYARPLIVQGAGAGAAVTAMGVMSDLLKLTF